jgi:zinc protease
MQVSKVTRHVLDNGMVVILKESHSAPLISWWVLYRVGSRNERSGQTGISHWTEHMMFKGTPKFDGQELDRMIDREGGTWNAQTSMDFTAYYATMPSDRIDLVLDLEADRMINAQFLENEVESERTVIISERQGAENSPLFWLGEEVQAAAFRVHGYHHEIIGDMADLNTITRDELYRHYQYHYQPSNAIGVAVGDFDSEEMLARIKARYNDLPSGPRPKTFMRPEPDQTGERRVHVERPGQTAFLEVAYRVPAAHHPEWVKLALLDSVLGGPSGVGGGNVDNKTSRLYKSLVQEQQIAASVYGGMYPSVDPYLYTITLVLRDGRTLEEAEAALDAELAKVVNGDITQAELDKAKKQARALFAYSTESVTGQAFWLAFCENFDNYTWFEQYVERLSAVTLAEVHEAARKYLRPQNRVVGWLIPTGEATTEAEEETEDVG